MIDVIKDLSELRMSYQRAALHEEDILSCPHEQFLAWFNTTLNYNLHEPYVMYLATASAAGVPHVRTLLLRGATAQGYDFYTNYDSCKGHDLAENPQAQLLFYWAELEQQVRISGRVEKISQAESTAYFQKRPHDSQVAAHVSTPQSGVIASREELQHRFDVAFAQYKDVEKLPKPEFWGGYRLVPDYYEFWQGRPNRLHDRIIYQKQGDDWVVERLMP